MRQMTPLSTSVSIVILVTTFFAAAAASPQSGYSIAWSQASISPVLPAGGSSSSAVSVTSKTGLKSIALEPTPSISPFLTITPAALDFIPAFQAQNISINFSIPSGTAPGTYDGTVHLRVGSQTLPQTLKITITVSQTPIIVAIPAGFQPNSQVIAQAGPVLLDNFGAQYQHGGLIPPGGAEITLTSNPLPHTGLPSVIASELQGATLISSSPVLVSATSCTEVTYSDSFGPNNNYSNITVYCPHNATLYKIFLSYTAGDPGAQQFLDAFQQVLTSVQFTL
jgi:hypothetical protein